MMRRSVLALALLTATVAPAGARSSTSITVTINPVTHRISGTVCSSGGRYCAQIGCTIAPVLPVTNSEVAMLPYHDCQVAFAVAVTGRLIVRGKPAKGVTVIAQSLNKDVAQCWPDTWPAAIVSCKNKVVRPFRLLQSATNAKGEFTMTLPSDVYEAGHRDLTVPALQTCKDIPVKVTVRSQGAAVTKSRSLHACA